MANIKISELDELQEVADQDLFVIVDSDENTTKKIQASNLNIKGGDTLPIGGIIEYDGTTVPQGYEKVNDSARTIMSAYNASAGEEISAFGTTTIALDTVISSIGTKLTLSNGSVKIGSGVSKVMVSGVLRGYFKNSTTTTNYEMGCRINKNTTIARTVEFIIDKNATIDAKLITVAPFLLDVEENDVISIGIYSSTGNAVRKYLANSYLTVEVVE